jgi:hypothetical protein
MALVADLPEDTPLCHEETQVLAHSGCLINQFVGTSFRISDIEDHRSVMILCILRTDVLRRGDVKEEIETFGRKLREHIMAVRTRSRVPIRLAFVVKADDETAAEARKAGGPLARAGAAVMSRIRGVGFVWTASTAMYNYVHPVVQTTLSGVRGVSAYELYRGACIVVSPDLVGILKVVMSESEERLTIVNNVDDMIEWARAT